MVDIRSVSNLPLPPNRIDRSSGTSSSESKRSAAGESSTSENADSIQISSDAKEAQAVSRLVTAAQSSPAVRPEAVERARETLARGGYEGEEVSREAARRIVEQLLGL